MKRISDILTIKRLFEIDYMFRHQHFITTCDLITTFQLDRRTIERYYKQLREYGAPLSYRGNRRAFCYTDNSFKLRDAIREKFGLQIFLTKETKAYKNRNRKD